MSSKRTLVSTWRVTAIRQEAVERERRRRGQRSSCHASHIAELVIDVQRCERDDDLGNRGYRRLEALAQRIEIRQPAGVEFGIDNLSEFGLAGSFVGKEQTTHWCAARPC